MCCKGRNAQPLTLASLMKLKDTTISNAIILPGPFCFHIMFHVDGLNISSERKV